MCPQVKEINSIQRALIDIYSLHLYSTELEMFPFFSLFQTLLF